MTTDDSEFTPVQRAQLLHLYRTQVLELIAHYREQIVILEAGLKALTSEPTKSEVHPPVRLHLVRG